MRDCFYPRRSKFQIGKLGIDNLTFVEAIDAIAELVERKEGGTVFTPNVDHVVLAEADERLRAAYAQVSLSLVDGMPVLWASRLLGRPLPEKISGSDLIVPLLTFAARRSWRVYLLGGSHGVADRAAARLNSKIGGINFVGTGAPQINIDGEPQEQDDVIASINAARPDLILVAFGCPKQEIFMHRVAQAVRPAVAIGVGAALDFEAGTVQRAPRWMSSAGLEWLHRLTQDPLRLGSRYLGRNPAFLRIVLRSMRASHGQEEGAVES